MKEDTRGRRAVCLIIDGCGIGPILEESKSGDKAIPMTLQHVAEQAGPLNLPVLQSLGLGNIASISGVHTVKREALGSWGACSLAHDGADTYMGHQELMGTIPPPVEHQLMEDVSDRLTSTLREHGHEVKRAANADSNHVLVVNGCAVVADNVEAARGVNINVTASLDDIGFDDLVELGQLVRRAVEVSRVIVVGGRGFDLTDILDHLVNRGSGQVGVDTPALGVYDENYRVRHLGIRVDYSRQLPSLAKASNLKVALLGKAADVVHCPDADVVDPAINTSSVMGLAKDCLSDFSNGLVPPLEGRQRWPESMTSDAMNTLVGRSTKESSSKDTSKHRMST